MKRLYLSFWDISLSNFPAGSFKKSRLSSEEAKDLIDSKAKSGSLLCVSADDLNAPYCRREKEKHDELRQVLLNTYDIDLMFRQFSTEDNDDPAPYYYINPLQIASIDKDSSLLVISCNYTMDRSKKDDSGFPNFSVAPDSVEYHLFEAL